MRTATLEIDSLSLLERQGLNRTSPLLECLIASAGLVPVGVTVSDNPYQVDQLTDSPPKQPSKALSCFGWALAFVVVMLVIVGLLLPATRRARPAVYRMHCSNNLKQISLALHNYEETYRSFPPAWTVDENGNRLHSWRTMILPYLEQKPLYDSIDLSKPWDDPANAARSLWRNSFCHSSERP